MKTCTKCGEEKPLGAYGQREGRPHTWCKGCVSEYQAAYRAAHRDKARETSRQWRRDNPERSRQSASAYKRANPEKVRAAQKKYRDANRTYLQERNWKWRKDNREQLRARARERYLANPEKAAEARDRRRALIARLEYEPFDRMETYHRFNGICQHCGLKCPPNGWHHDHIIPAALGGHRTRKNMQVLCPSCNTAKGRKLDFLCRKPNRPQLLPATR